MIHKRVQIPLIPASIGSEEEFIVDLIQSRWLHKFVEELNGVLLNYKNMKFSCDFGEIRDDLPFIFWDIEADFYLFKPVAGAIVRGKIVRFSRTNLISCLLNDCMSASVMKPNPVPPELDEYLKINCDVFFRVDKINYENAFVQGIITEECIQRTIRDIALPAPEEPMEEGAPSNMEDF
jgi:DNA-directed RNA polymerase I subunit RPA43